MTVAELPAYLHTLPLPTPFPIGPVNVYVFEGEPLTLVDTGPRARVSRAALAAGLAALGRRLEDIGRIILTHHHVDHVGLAADIQARSGAEVWTHPYNVPWLCDYPAHREANRPFYDQVWHASGVPADVIQAMDAAGAGFAAWQDPVTPTHILDEGTQVDLGGQPWHVFHTPGHAGGLICLWEPHSRTLLANDHFLRDISSNPILEPPPTPGQPRPRRLVEYLQHMQRMAGLDPARALPGHGEVVEDVRGLVRRRLAFHQRRAERILEVLDGQSRTLWELTAPIFPHVRQPMDYFLALSEILGHLDLLERDGLARPEPAGGVVRWTRL